MGLERAKKGYVKFRQNHPKEYEIRRKKYLENNKNRLWAMRTISGHRFKGYDVQVTEDELLEKRRVTITCRYCGEVLQYDKKKMIALDRIHNENFLTNDNTQIICRKCN
ncbi:MAG: hypothetical protein WBZ36_22135, partial [Candidatus Nitrosopolaris sp.]